MTQKIRVLVVDDSAVIRQMLCGIIGAQPDMEVVDAAQDPFDAREKIKRHNPDVLTLDVEMPKMDGLSFLEKIMTLRPMPVIMVSTLTGKGTETAIAALQIGAVECIAKPLAHNDAELAEFAAVLTEKIRIASVSRIRPYSATTRKQDKNRRTLSAQAPRFIAIGSSTGGVEAVTEVLCGLPANMPPIVITQHMPPVFTASFARRLSTLCELKVEEGKEQAPLESGKAYIAPGGLHMEVVKSAGGYACRVYDSAPVNNHKPSVDVLFNSVAQQARSEALGIILTGMGKDGARGLLAMRKTGAHTIGQDEASCIVYGMPRAAYELGAVEDVRPLSAIADAIKERCFV